MPDEPEHSKEEIHEVKERAEELKGKPGVRNPWALSWWLENHQRGEKRE